MCILTHSVKYYALSAAKKETILSFRIVCYGIPFDPRHHMQIWPGLTARFETQLPSSKRNV